MLLPWAAREQRKAPQGTSVPYLTERNSWTWCFNMGGASVWQFTVLTFVPGGTSSQLLPTKTIGRVLCWGC